MAFDPALADGFSGSMRGTRMTMNHLERSRWAGPGMLMVTYVVAIGLLVMSMVVVYRIVDELQDSGKIVSRAMEAVGGLSQIGTSLYAAEAAQLGYVLTGKDADLGRYHDLHRLIDSRLDEVGRLISDTPAQRERLNTLRSLGEQRFASMDRTLDAYRAGGVGNALSVLDTDEAVSAMARVRTTLDAMHKEEMDRLTERLSSRSNPAIGGFIRPLVTGVAVAGALSLFFLLALRYRRQRDVALDAVEAGNADLERRISERTAELSNLSRHLLGIREDEKKNIARELHDEFGSFLTAINMDVSRLRDKISVTHPEQAAKFDRTLSLLNQTIDMKRRLISELRPSILDNLGLGAALEQYIDEWSNSTGIATRFDHSGDFDGVKEGCLIAIFRVFQEALDNVARHSGATAVDAYLRRSGESIEFEVADNGIGISEAARTKPGTHGLLGIRERVLAYRGRVEFLKGPTGGNVIRASLPGPASNQGQTPAAATATF